MREPGPDDLCYLSEEGYVSSGILEDVLKQNGIPYLTKGVLGAGITMRIGPMLERCRFYVPWPRLEEAQAIREEIFSAVPDGGEAPEEADGEAEEESAEEKE